MLTSRECAAFLLLLACILLAHLSTAIFCSATRDGDFFASEKSFVDEEALPFDENDHAQTRALLWSQKAPDLNVLDTTKSTENTQTTSIADQLVKELDTVVDETSASQRAAGDIASANDDDNDDDDDRVISLCAGLCDRPSVAQGQPAQHLRSWRYSQSPESSSSQAQISNALPGKPGWPITCIP